MILLSCIRTERYVASFIFFLTVVFRLRFYSFGDVCACVCVYGNCQLYGFANVSIVCICVSCVILCYNMMFHCLHAGLVLLYSIKRILGVFLPEHPNSIIITFSQEDNRQFHILQLMHSPYTNTHTQTFTVIMHYAHNAHLNAQL